MNSREELSPLARALRGAVLALMAVAASSTHAATIWTGPTISYTQPGTDPTQPANQDRLTPNVWLTRGSIQGLFNAKSEIGFTHSLSPADTAWANGTTANYAALSYTDWNTWAKTVNGGPPGTVGIDAVLHLISEDIYLDIKFTSWPSHGTFAYLRSTPATGLPSPTVSITNPVNNAVFAAPANVTIAATATVSGGSVTNVEFFGNGAPLGSDQTAPFSITTGNLAAGPYVLTAVATAAGISATSSVVNITVVSPSPTVNITNPVNNAVFAAPANVTIAATATVSSGSVTNVEFFGNSNSLGSVQASPFNLTTGNLAAGSYALNAVATAAGVSATSSVINITVVSPSPTVSITNPVNNAIFAAPTNVTIAATATVSSGSVTNVEFFGNGAPLGADQTAPFSITTGNLAAGPYALIAVATAAGISATSSVVNITVTSPSPTVSITNPVNNAVFAAPANVTIRATATVSSGSVTNVEFFGNGAPLGSDQTAPFSITTGNLAAGPYALIAVATAAGISATSSVVNITVVSLPSPTVSITNPVNGAVFAAPANVTIAATATVSSGSVTNVEFFGNSNSLGSDQAFPFNLTTGNLAAGSYALNAVATAAGVSATSSVVNITVVSPVAVSVTAPVITNGQFSFDYTANTGLTYVVENSSNLVNWLPAATNVAAGNPAHFTDSFVPGGSRYYRVGRLPNP